VGRVGLAEAEASGLIDKEGLHARSPSWRRRRWVG
jgi:hypothetical protein